MQSGECCDASLSPLPGSKSVLQHGQCSVPYGQILIDHYRPCVWPAYPVVSCGDKFSAPCLISILCTGTHELLLLFRIPVHAASALAFCPHATPFPF